VISSLTGDFRRCFAELPESVRVQARKTYQIWEADPFHPSLQFKKVHKKEEIWSVRIGRHWRALGVIEGEEITWFWIGSHSDYDELLSHF